MKIHSIRLENLNSLKGAHFVDLTAEPLAGAGLFAITGPTGAGKSTLLDAITLALFGRAARYGNESNPEDVMSRHCGQCSAEVVFEVPGGVYRATWERRRARNKADGALQPPKRYLYDAMGQVLADQIRDAEARVEALLGLNYERFLRSVLLAQGEFSKFLKARADERAELLESLTGTVIYSRLGQLAHSEAARMAADLKRREEAMEQISVLSDDDRGELLKAMESGKEQLGQLDRALEEGARMLEKIARLQAARSNEQKAEAELRDIEKCRGESKKDLETLMLHRRTMRFAEDIGRLEAAESALQAAIKDDDKATLRHRHAKDALDAAIRNLRMALEGALAASTGKAVAAREAMARVRGNVEAARMWLDEHKRDAVLADQIGDLAAAIGTLKSARTSFRSIWTDWRESASGILPEVAAACLEVSGEVRGEHVEGMLEEFLAVAEERRQAMEESGREAKRQFDLRKDHLEKAKLVAGLADHRHALSEGEACPLCGALEHPYAGGAEPSIELAALERELRLAEEKLVAARDAYQGLDKTLRKLKADRAKPLEALRALDDATAELAEKLGSLGEKPPAPGDEDGLRMAFQKREKEYRLRLEVLAKSELALKEEERKAAEADKESGELKERIAKLPPAQPGSDVNGSGMTATVGEAEETHAGALSRLHVARQQAEDRTHDRNKAAQVLDGVKQPLEEAVAHTEFKTLEALRLARLPVSDAERLERIEKQLGDRATAVNALIEQARREIAPLLGEGVLEGEAAKRFQDAQTAGREARDSLLKEQTTRGNQLEADAANRNRREEADRLLRQDRKALVVWTRLRELIGSHDGGKFRKYAQSISLDILSRHANRHLIRLSDRYRIRRDPGEALDIQIEDLDQAGARRPMASLSGGESFLVSLALALGLSDLAGRTVRIESLFVDEGFGTLDPETLEIAIAALETLRQDHKTVGVISHVGLLKERIGTQIVVEKLVGGVSRITVVS